MGWGAALGGIGGAVFGGPAGAMVGASIGGAFDAQAGASKANDANKNMAREQMAFQERMSSSAHQRQVADLKAAGLNPILSANTGASSPSGSMATMQNEEAQTVQAVQAAASTALQNKRLQQDLKNLKAQEKQIQTQTQKTKTENTLLEATEPEARLRNKVGQYAENLASSAKSMKMPDKSIANLIPAVEKHKIRKATIKAKSNYKKSQAFKDAQRARERKAKLKR